MFWFCLFSVSRVSYLSERHTEIFIDDVCDLLQNNPDEGTEGRSRNKTGHEQTAAEAGGTGPLDLCTMLSTVSVKSAKSVSKCKLSSSVFLYGGP